LDYRRGGRQKNAGPVFSPFCNGGHTGARRGGRAIWRRFLPDGERARGKLSARIRGLHEFLRAEKRVFLTFPRFGDPKARG